MFRALYLGTFVLFFIFNAGMLFAQSKSVSGQIVDKLTNEPLIGVYVTAPSQKTGITTDSNGNFELNIAGDTCTLFIEYLGYNLAKIKINNNSTFPLAISLTSSATSLNEVIVDGDGVRSTIERNQMSMMSISTKESKLVPVFFGEIDLMKTLALKPGVSNGSEGNSGLYVRGGGPDQNLILIDDALVFNASHLLGFFSLLNPEAVKSIDLYKGDFPAQYGGRLSSIVNIKMAEGSKEKFGVSGGIGLIASRLSIEGPIIKNKVSFIVSARRTYVDLFTPIINERNKNKVDYDKIPSYYFYDFNTKIAADLGKKDKLSFTGYWGRDVLKLDNNNFDASIRWGNIIGVVNWKHDYSSKLFSTISLSFSNYKYAILYQGGDLTNKLSTKVTDLTAKIDFQYYPNSKNIVRFGTQIISHNFNIGRIQRSVETSKEEDRGNALSALEAAVYISDEVTINSKWKANIGTRLTGYRNDSNYFGGIEPRLSTSYQLGKNISFKSSFSRMYQYLHLVSNSGATLPNDIWYPSNSNIKPQRSDQLAGGINIGLWDNRYLLSNEVYYKWMKRQIDLKDGAAIFEIPDVSTGFAVGKGWSYGNEIYLEKKKGKLTGWIGYTLSWTWRQFNEINNGNKFPARYDRRHNVSVVAMYRISDRLTLSASWVYATGNAITLPNGRFIFQDIGSASPNYIPEFMPRNSFRMPSSHRLDVGLIYNLNTKRGTSDITLSVYNAYNRRNPYFIYFEREKQPDGTDSFLEFRAKQVSLFPIIPSIAYNFKF